MRPAPAPTPTANPRDIYLGSDTHFPYVILSESRVLDPFIEMRMSDRERELTHQGRRARAQLARCVRNGTGIVRYQVRLSPTRARGGPAAACVTRALRRARLSGSGRFELALNFRDETPAGVYIVDREHRPAPPPQARQASPPAAQPRQACAAPVVNGTLRRSGDDDNFPDFLGMRGEAIRQHRTGPIAEAACAGLQIEVLNPWSRRDARTGAPNEFERSWARRVRQRKVLVLACIPSDQRPPSWALTFQVAADGTVTPLHEATPAMAECITRRISPPPRAYRLHVNFGETPEELYVDTR